MVEALDEKTGKNRRVGRRADQRKNARWQAVVCTARHGRQQGRPDSGTGRRYPKQSADVSRSGRGFFGTRWLGSGVLAGDRRGTYVSLGARKAGWAAC